MLKNGLIITFLAIVQYSISQCSITTTSNVLSAPSCGASDGSFDITPTSGTAPYQYSLDGGTTYVPNSTFSNLSAGPYSIITQDAAGCLDTSIVLLNNPGGPTVVGTVTDNSCFNGNDGSINVSISGGTPPTNKQWSGGSTSTSEDISAISSGSYSIAVTDAANCVTSQTFTVTEPTQIIPSVAQSVVSCNGASSLTSSATGGTGGYTYSWSNGSSGSSIALAVPGSYTLTVSDANNCSESETINVEAIDQICLTIPTFFTPNDDGINDTWEIGGISTYNEPVVRVFNRWGELVLYSKGYENSWDGKLSGLRLPMGPYYYVIELQEVPDGVVKGVINLKI